MYRIRAAGCGDGSVSEGFIGDDDAGCTVPPYANQILRRLLKGIVMADDEELAKATNVHDLLRQRFPPNIVQIRRRLVEKGDIQLAHFADEGQPHGQRGAHLLAARQLGKLARGAIHFQADAVVLVPTAAGG